VLSFRWSFDVLTIQEGDRVILCTMVRCYSMCSTELRCRPGIGLERKARSRGRDARIVDERLRALALSSAWSITHLLLRFSLVIRVRRLCPNQFKISDSNACDRADGLRAIEVSTCVGLLHSFVFSLLTCQPETGLRPTNSAHTLASERKRAITISSHSMLQPSSYLTGIPLAPGLVTSLILDLSPAPMPHTHTYGYSGLRIGGQIPGRILDAGGDTKAFEFRNGHLGMVKGKMMMNQGDGVKKRTERCFSQETIYSET
jgi:hypothetical protein